ncbi:MAG: hypothetical protein J0M20_15000, partial [Burkholderiales bacterium]|nr:hypothetical protein [Burkholderiales bacterium]
LPLLVLLAPAWAGAVSCEDLREQVLGRFKVNGVADAQIDIVDPAAPGREVGRCNRGANKLVLRPRGAATATAPAPRAVITECDDGRTVTAGRCRPS